MSRSLRDHGYGNKPEVRGAPIVGDRVPGGVCQNCGCVTVYGISVEVANPPPMLRRPTEPHRVVGHYVGCPACPWASPMLTGTEVVNRDTGRVPA